jgi:cell division protein ZapA
MNTMPNVSFSIGARSYTLRCAAGQEDHLRQMAAALNQRIQPLATAVTGADDRQLLVIAAIAILDELAAADAAKADTGGGSDDGASGNAEIQAANHQLQAENTAMKADLMALRKWADSMGGRLTTLSQSLGALAPASADD